MIQLGTSATCTIKYYGRDITVSHSDIVVVETVKLLRDVINDITPYRNESWKGLKDDIISITNNFMNPSTNIKRYKIEILHDGVLPYMKKIQSRVVLDKDRFSQLQSILFLLSNNTVENTVPNVHPATTLGAIDNIIREINSKGGWFKSELAVSLDRAVKKQWQPVIADTRNALLNWGAKVGAVGLAEIVGRSYLMLWPIYMIIMDVLRIVKTVEEKKGLTAEVVVQLVKSIILMYVVSQLLAILAAFNGVGYICLLTSAVALVVSTSDSLIKHFTPVISPNLALLDETLEQVTAFEKTLVRKMRMNPIDPVAASTDPTAPHPQVEEVHGTAVSATSSYTPSGGDLGLRKRKPLGEGETSDERRTEATYNHQHHD